MRLDYADIERYVPAQIGQVKVEHCRKGSPKLYITRKANGIILAHCFHCGASGYWKPDIRPVEDIKRLLKQQVIDIDGTVVYPDGYTTDITKWSDEAYAWIFKYGITHEEVSTYGIGFTSCYNGIVLPVYDDGSALGYQCRRMDHRGGAKYISIKISHRFYDFRPSRYGGGGGGDTVVVVEDYLSALKCRRYADAIALLGTNLSDAACNRISGYKKFIVFLDNDTAQVLKDRSKIARRLSNFGEVSVVELKINPKELSDIELKELLYGR